MDEYEKRQVDVLYLKTKVLKNVQTRAILPLGCNNLSQFTMFL